MESIFAFQALSHLTSDGADLVRLALGPVIQSPNYPDCEEVAHILGLEKSKSFFCAFNGDNIVSLASEISYF